MLPMKCTLPDSVTRTRISIMHKWTYCFMTLTLLLLHCAFLSAQDLTRIQKEIEKQRETNRIRNKIIKALQYNGISSNVGAVDATVESGPTIKHIPQKEDIVRVPEPEPVLVVIGEPDLPKKGCLVFKMGKYMKQPNVQIVPFRMSLWLHIRLRNKKSKKKSSVSKRSIDSEIKVVQKRSTDENNTRHKKKQRGKKKKDRKKKKKPRKGRRIKIFVSNSDDKTFVQMRMRVANTGWNKIELPISQFPDVINANDSFKLCIKCKRCGKKVKIDLFKKPRPPTTRIKDKPTIPFIHFENRSQLPQSLQGHRRRRSSDVIPDLNLGSQYSLTSQQRHLSASTCCQKETFSDNIQDYFPRILYPESINITYCGTSEGMVPPSSDSLVTSDNYPTALNRRYKCEASSRDDLSLTFLDNSYNVKQVVIENVIPSSCECRYIH